MRKPESVKLLRSYEMARLFQATFLVVHVIVLAAVPAYGIGSGGILNRVPQATVSLTDLAGNARTVERTVYVHPLEGSLLIVDPTSPTAIALDKNKRHAITIEVRGVSFSESGDQVDVPEHTPFTVLRNAPHFDRTYASLLLEDGSTLVVRVKR